MSHENETEHETETAGYGARHHPLITKTDWEFLTTEGYFEKHNNPSVSRAQQRMKLRDRLRNAVLDFTLLFEYLDVEDGWVDVFTPENYENDEGAAWYGGVGNTDVETDPYNREERENRLAERLAEGLKLDPQYVEAKDDDMDLADVEHPSEIQLKPPTERPIGVYEGMVDTVALFFKSVYERNTATYPQATVEQLVEASIKRVLADRGEKLYDCVVNYETTPPDIAALKERFFDGEVLSYTEFEILRHEGNMVDPRGKPVDPADMAGVSMAGVGASNSPVSVEEESDVAKRREKRESSESDSDSDET